MIDRGEWRQYFEDLTRGCMSHASGVFFPFIGKQRAAFDLGGFALVVTGSHCDVEVLYRGDKAALKPAAETCAAALRKAIAFTPPTWLAREWAKGMEIPQAA